MTSEWAMVVLTGIYVVATIFICLFNYGSTKASKAQAAEMRRQFDEDNRPYITVELIYERKVFFGLRFSNHGKRLANHVRIQFNQEFIDSIYYSKKFFLTGRYNDNSASLKKEKKRLRRVAKKMFNDVSKMYASPFGDLKRGSVLALNLCLLYHSVDP